MNSVWNRARLEDQDRQGQWQTKEVLVVPENEMGSNIALRERCLSSGNRICIVAGSFSICEFEITVKRVHARGKAGLPGHTCPAQVLPHLYPSFV